MSLRPQREDARHRHAAGVADAESPRYHPQGLGGLCRAAAELDVWRRTRRAMDHHIGERNPGAEARAERLEHCFLGGEPPRQPLDPIGTIADLVELSLNEATLYQRVARIFDPALHFGDVHQVNAMSDDVHKTLFRLGPTDQCAPNTKVGGFAAPRPPHQASEKITTGASR